MPRIEVNVFQAERQQPTANRATTTERTLQVQVLCLNTMCRRRLWEVTSWGLVQLQESVILSVVKNHKLFSGYGGGDIGNPSFQRLHWLNIWK